MNDASERTILKEGSVKVTNLIATFGTRTYTVSNIAFARMQVKEPNFFLPVFFAVTLGICSVLVAISNLEEYSRLLQVGLYGGIAGILFFLFSRRTKYSVQIRSGGRELSVLETGDRNYAERIVKAVNEAIGKIEGSANVPRRLQVDR
jgi:Family of unknown function (DUF6232)